MSETTAPSAPVASASRLGRIIAGCSLGSYLNVATVLIYPFSLFAAGIAAESGRPAKDITGLIGVALLLTLITQPIIGWIVNRWPSRPVVLSAQALLVAALLLLSAAPTSQTAFGVVLTVATTLGVLANPMVYSAYIARTFSVRRGLALGVAQAFTGVGVATLPPLSAFAVQHFGWRGGYLVLAALAAAALAINCLLLPASRTEQSSSGAAAPAKPSKDLLGQIVRRPIFWSLCAIFFLLAIAANGVPVFLPLILQSRGASAELAAVSLSILGVGMIVSRPLLGWLIDRWSIRYVMAIMLLGPLVGSAALLLSDTAGMAYLAAVGFALAIGGEFVGLGYLVARIFGVQSFGLVYGWIAMALALGVAVGPIILGRLSSGRDYSVALEFILAAAAVALVLTMISLRDKHLLRTPD